MVKIKRKFGELLNTMESRWSLWKLLQGIPIVASFTLPAWAVDSINLFVEYRPLSWVVAGFIGLFVWVVCYSIWQWGKRTAINIKYDAKLIEKGDKINPLDQTFEGKRIFINDFVLPSNPTVENKTFINCEIVGPACLHFLSNNIAKPLKPPVIDGVWLDPSKLFYNGITLSDCIFRDCSFQGITIFASVENYEDWKENPNVNWISTPPQTEHIKIRKINLGMIPADKSKDDSEIVR